MADGDPRQQALAARDAFALEPTSLVGYRSAGRVIALGDAESLRHCDSLPPAIEIERLAVSGPVQIEGFLGAFTVRLGDAQGKQTEHRADAVVDLHEQPLLARELPPPGYFHAPPAAWAELGLEAELDGITGEFEKPKYFAYDASICAHAVNGKTVCRRCIDACPAEAIASIGESIEVDPGLCQGGGSCATVCPSGAIRYLYPNLRDSGQRLRGMLDAYRAAGGADAVLLFYRDGEPVDDYLETYDKLLPIPVEELASVGMDLCLSALAYGASQVVLLADDALPASSRASILGQLEWLHALLGELGLGSAHVALCERRGALPTVNAETAVAPALHDMPSAKRDAIFRALDHLVAQLEPAADRARLPSAAPFGEVSVDSGACTLCMACVGACPGRALQDGSNREVPELFFIESNCLQCGACVQTCPEDAISLAPRLLFDAEARNRARALNRDTPFACISCGKPFAPTSVINKMQDKLKDHYMFGSQRALDRLKMCEDCRVVDIVQDPEALGGQFDPLKNFKQ